MKRYTCLILIVSTALLMGCKSQQRPPSYISNSTAYDSAPREGWATDPNYSYRLYSYYPVNFNPGGFYGNLSTSQVWTGQPFPN